MIDFAKARWKALSEAARAEVLHELDRLRDGGAPTDEDDGFEVAAALLKALSPQKTYPEDDGINALIRWRDAAALDWTGFDLVVHIAGILDRDDLNIPSEHGKGYQNYLKLSEEERIDRITAVVNPEDE